MKNINKFGAKLVVFITLMTLLVSCGNETKQTFSNMGGSTSTVSTLIVPEGKTFLGINISNQPYIVVKKLIIDENNKIVDDSFNIKGKEKTYNIKYGDIDYKLSEDEIIQSLKDNAENNLIYTYSQEKLDTILNTIKKEENIYPSEPSVKRIEGGFSVTEGVTGSVIDEEKYASKLKEALDLKLKEFSFEYIEQSPKYTKSDFDALTCIGSYSTKYKTSATARNKNLAQACNKINNVVVYPNEVFSTNEHYGPTTIANGYAIANVIVNNELVEGVGGGVCQISSTLYNAILRAELNIVERRNHSLPVSYAPLGFDATLANPYIDFKFKNDTDEPVVVTAWIDNGTANVYIYGKEVHNSGRTLNFRSTVVSTSKAGEKTVEDDTLEAGKRVIDTAPLDGKVVQSYKDIYENGKLIETVSLGRSDYARKDAVVKVGTKPVEKTPTESVPVEQAPVAVNEQPAVN